MLTPLEIENKKFSKQMVNGYNVDEVDEFLDLLTADYEKLYKENVESREKIEQLNSDIEHYKTIESTLQGTLMMAQSTAEEVKNVARQQADQIINDAQITARQEVSNLEQQIILKRKELEDAEKQFDIYKAKMESLLISQLELLKDINKD
jgi:cell division initiation protein